MTDEGVNGLFVHLRNDTPRRVEGALTLSCYRDGKVQGDAGDAESRRSSRMVSIALRDVEFWGGFFDTALAYGFRSAVA